MLLVLQTGYGGFPWPVLHCVFCFFHQIILHLAKKQPNSPSQTPKQPAPQFRTNELIRVPQVRLVGENMEEVSRAAGKEIAAGEVYNTREVRDWAEKLVLDLVEISPNAAPPVVRIVDFNKFLYEKKKKEKEIKAKAAKTVIKEIRFGPNTDDHDFEFKVRHAKTFLEEGAKVKAYVNFRGRTIVFKDRGELLLLRFLKELEEFGAPESLPKLEGRRMIVMVTPKKTVKKK
jgi:translation initiation factor IF-3